MMKRCVGLLVASVLAIGACGGGDGDEVDEPAGVTGGGDGGALEDPSEPDTTTGEIDPLVAAVAASIRNPDDPSEALPTTDEALCVARGTVDSIGAERLAELGVTVDDVPAELVEFGLDANELERVVDIELACIDFRRLLSETFVVDVGISSGGAECLAAAFPADLIRRAALAEGSSDPAAVDGLDAAYVEALSAAAPGCLTASELAATGLG